MRSLSDLNRAARRTLAREIQPDLSDEPRGAAELSNRALGLAQAPSAICHGCSPTPRACRRFQQRLARGFRNPRASPSPKARRYLRRARRRRNAAGVLREGQVAVHVVDGHGGPLGGDEIVSALLRVLFTAGWRSVLRAWYHIAAASSPPVARRARRPDGVSPGGFQGVVRDAPRVSSALIEKAKDSTWKCSSKP